MEANNIIEYFNHVSLEIFGCLGEIKYSIRLLEINQNKNFIGFSIDTEYFCAQITVLTKNNPGYLRDRSCSMQLYSFDDYNLDNVLFESVSMSIDQCISFLIDKDIYNNITTPKYHLN